MIIPCWPFYVRIYLSGCRKRPRMARIWLSRPCFLAPGMAKPPPSGGVGGQGVSGVPRGRERGGKLGQDGQVNVQLHPVERQFTSTHRAISAHTTLRR